MAEGSSGRGGGGGNNNTWAQAPHGLPTLEPPDRQNGSSSNAFGAEPEGEHPPMVPPQYAVPGNVPGALTSGLPLVAPPSQPPPPSHPHPPQMVPSQVQVHLHPDAYNHGGGGHSPGQQYNYGQGYGGGGQQQQQQQQQQYAGHPHNVGGYGGTQQPQQQYGARGQYRASGPAPPVAARNRSNRDGRYERGRNTNAAGGGGGGRPTNVKYSRDPRVWARYWKTKLSSDSPTKSECWLAAISEAENKAQEHGGNSSSNSNNRGRAYGRRRNTADDGTSSPKLVAAGYLKHLRNLLERNKDKFDDAPQFYPPPPRWDAELLHDLGRNMPATAAANNPWEELPGDAETAATGGGRNESSNSNRYSAFENEEEEEEDDDDTDDGDDSDELSDEEIVFHPPNAPSSPKPKKIKMAMRRLIVRVLASQADIHASLGIDHSRARPIARWIEGADEYAISFNVLTAGQLIVDAEYAKLLQMEEDADVRLENMMSKKEKKKIDATKRKKADLAADSEIIAVSLSSFLRNRDRYINAANSRIEYLEGRLYQNQQSREEVRQSMGERWVNNPNAKGDYAERRKRMEEELQQAQQGVERMERMDVEVVARTVQTADV